MTEKSKPPLPLNELTAITTVDGRYRRRTAELAPFVSEYALIKTRVEIESKYLIALSDAGVVRPLLPEEKEKLSSFGENLSVSDAEKVKGIEDKTNHDVKAMERTFRSMLEGTSLEDLIESIHMGLTSEDVNNLAYRLMLKRATKNVFIPILNLVVDEITNRAETFKATPMLARTHGQAAIPTTVGKELVVFADRLNSQVRKLEDRKLTGKLTGAVGNLSALQFAFPDIDWISFTKKFVSSFGLEPQPVTTQINPYEDMIEVFQNYQRINGIIIDFDQDMWRYISDYWFAQQVKEGETGSSTMPQKVNPIDFENSEGNLGMSDAIFEFFSRKLAQSRLQRDLSDSTVIRNEGLALGLSLVAYKSTLAGLSRAKLNEKQISKDLGRDWTILAEGCQTLLRVKGVKDPYSLFADLTRGKHMGEEEWLSLIDQLPVGDIEKGRLRKLTPETYIGLAVEITENAIKKIRESRKR